ncbi:MAG: hypothetical protein DRJ65_14305 [Acidobacteria bacterium]|nr:MAG: hypothetical protein DRJ65_14305 [Acidobacteriota bacterium]
MTSAAYGVSHHSIANRAAVGCPVSPFFASAAWLEVLQGEERAHPAHPDLAFCALSGLYVGVGCSVTVAGPVCGPGRGCSFRPLPSDTEPSL